MASGSPDNDLLRRRFDAAVNTIKNLPKNGTEKGSFQPSNALKLKFYSLYKQATQGAASGGRPSMFDLVGRAKWDAWKALDAMSAAEAMQDYVDEIVSVAQNMSDSPEKEQFLAVMVETPETSEPVEAEAASSESRSALVSADSTVNVDEAVTKSPLEADATAASILEDELAGSGPRHDNRLDAAAPAVAAAGSVVQLLAEETSTADWNHTTASAHNSTDSTLLMHSSATPSSMLSETDNDDEFCDVMESFTSDDDDNRNDDELMPSASFMASTPYIPFSAAAARPTTSVLGTSLLPSTPVADLASARSSAAGAVPYGNAAATASGSPPPPGSRAPATVGYISSQQLTAPGAGRGAAAASASGRHHAAVTLESSVESLCGDVAAINARLADVEAGLQGVKEGRPQLSTVRERAGPSWWPFHGWSASVVASLMLWPFLANYILALLFRRRRQGQ